MLDSNGIDGYAAIGAASPVRWLYAKIELSARSRIQALAERIRRSTLKMGTPDGDFKSAPTGTSCVGDARKQISVRGLAAMQEVCPSNVAPRKRREQRPRHGLATCQRELRSRGASGAR